MNTVLVVDDDAAIREMIRMALESNGYAVLEAGDTIAARQLLETGEPDIMLLDWMLPGQSGYEFTRSLRRKPVSNSIPVIMLTARDREEEKVAALESGADDYISKPFSVKELQARIKAVLRRSATESDNDVLKMGGLELDKTSHRVTATNSPLRLSPMEYQLLLVFMQNPERVYSRAQLIDRLRGRDVDIEERTIDVHIRRLRKVLEPTGHHCLIQTVRGSGYRFSTHD
ncbi:MAG: phosphate regulon transcriptional regulator PhoB [Gammaproteobacteria bacterium]|nr:phosphate regulon transcriptional regulator PhoB [Gammaproteobacteria bacterium]